MNISPVSFGSVPMSFSERVNAPQRYIQKETPTAATSLSKPVKKQGTFLGKVVKLAIAAAVVAGGLACGAKKGVFNPDKFQNETIKKAMGHLQTAGEKIGEKATKYYGVVKEKLSAGAAKAGEKASEVVQEVTEKAPEVVQEAVEKAQDVVGGAVWTEQSNLEALKTQVQKHSQIVEKASEAADKAFSIAQEQFKKVSQG